MTEFIRLEQRSVEWTKELEQRQWKNYEEHPDLVAKNSVFSDSLMALMETYDDTPKTPNAIWKNISEHKHKVLAFIVRHYNRDRYDIPLLKFSLSYEFLNNNIRIFLSQYLQKNLGEMAQYQHTYAYAFEPIVIAQRNGNQICGSVHLGCLFQLPTLTLRPLSNSGKYELAIKPIFYYCRPNIQPYVAIERHKNIQKLSKSPNGTYHSIPLTIVDGIDSNSYSIPLQMIPKTNVSCE